MEIKNTILKFLGLENLLKHLTGYLESKVALVKTELREELAHLLSKSILILIFVLLGFSCLLFFSFGAALYFNTYLQSEFAGYLIVAGFFGLLFLILIIFRKNLLGTFERHMIEMIKSKAR